MLGLPFFGLVPPDRHPGQSRATVDVNLKGLWGQSAAVSALTLRRETPVLSNPERRSTLPKCPVAPAG